MTYQKSIKRPLDLCIALILLVALSPLLVVLVISLLVSNNGRPFFVQKRAGKNSRVFNLIKFRTMTSRMDDSGILLTDVERTTKFGHLIRSLSLDELPQLVNVIKGDMSLIGPRPLLVDYLPFYSEYHQRRHDVRPGITGLAQVKGRNNLKFSERFNYDVNYVENISFLLDFKIGVATIVNVFKRSNISTGQFADDIDDLGITAALPANYFRSKQE